MIWAVGLIGVSLALSAAVLVALGGWVMLELRKEERKKKKLKDLDDELEFNRVAMHKVNALFTQTWQ